MPLKPEERQVSVLITLGMKFGHEVGQELFMVFETAKRPLSISGAQFWRKFSMIWTKISLDLLQWMRCG